MTDARSSEWSWLDDLSGELDSDLLEALAEEPDPQHRPELDDLFE